MVTPRTHKIKFFTTPLNLRHPWVSWVRIANSGIKDLPRVASFQTYICSLMHPNFIEANKLMISFHFSEICTAINFWLLNRPYEKEVTSNEHNWSSKRSWAVELVVYLSNGFRTFHTINMKSVAQRAAKLLAVNVGGLKKKSAIRPWPQSASLPGFDSGRSLIIFKVWQPATVKPFDEKTSNFQHLKIYTSF